jgi:hypothetical protein
MPGDIKILFSKPFQLHTAKDPLQNLYKFAFCEIEYVMLNNMGIVDKTCLFFNMM